MIEDDFHYEGIVADVDFSVEGPLRYPILLFKIQKQTKNRKKNRFKSKLRQILNELWEHPKTLALGRR